MSSLSLESFETVATDSFDQGQAFAQGYDEGFAAGLAAANADNATLSSSLVQTFSDISFTYAEARAQILQSLGPLIETLTSAVLPHCVVSGFAGVLAQELSSIAGADTSAPICVHVHPDQQVAVQQVVAGLQSEITVQTDHSLDLHAARISRANTETQLDLDQLLMQITEALNAITLLENRTNAHG